MTLLDFDFIKNEDISPYHGINYLQYYTSRKKSENKKGHFPVGRVHAIQYYNNILSASPSL